MTSSTDTDSSITYTKKIIGTLISMVLSGVWDKPCQVDKFMVYKFTACSLTYSSTSRSLTYLHSSLKGTLTTMGLC